MSRKANPTLIGAFVLGAVALAVVATLLLAGGSWFGERRQHVLYFEGAAQGLQVGAPVVFLGVKVGTVRQIQLGLDSLPDRGSRTGWRNVDHGDRGAGLGGRILDRAEDRDAEDRLAGLLGVHPCDEAVLAVRVFLALLGMELTGLAGNALRDDLGVFVDQNAHLNSFTT